MWKNIKWKPLTLMACLALAQGAENGVVEAAGLAATTDTQDPNSVSKPNNDIAKKNGDLSDKLNSTNGVILPEGDQDPGMARPAPAVGDGAGQPGFPT